jgi:hypothetical protein
MMRRIAVIGWMVVGLLCMGCREQPGFYGSAAGELVFERYLNGSPDEARATLNGEVESIESNEALSRAAKAARLFTTYTRLYWLERRAGQEEAALTILGKAREKNVSRFELEGVSKEEAILRAESADPVSMKEEIEKLDRSLNGGNAPKFYSTLQER